MAISLALLAESWVLWVMISSPQYPVTVPGGAYNSSKACIVDAWTQADLQYPRTFYTDLDRLLCPHIYSTDLNGLICKIECVVCSSHS
jgi:hypothetical protein